MSQPTDIRTYPIVVCVGHVFICYDMGSYAMVLQMVKVDGGMSVHYREM